MDRPDSGGPMSDQHAGLLKRVGTLLRPTVKRGRSDPAEASTQADPSVKALQERIDRLEALVEGLQDAVHRQSLHQNERIEELYRRTQPVEMARALSADARRRGL